ncbi:MAG: formylglycine-generating enzyme family protein [Bradymonadia bacterium]
MHHHIPGLFLIVLSLVAGLSDASAQAAQAGKGQITYLHVPGGTFTMGRTDGPQLERPAHTVTVKSFWLSKSEITVEQFMQCFTEGACSAGGLTADPACNWGKRDRLDHPINCVSWRQARAFAQWAGGRLPTEAEWAYAARGAEGRPYPWGAEPPTCTQAVMHSPEGKAGCGAEGTRPVCSISAPGQWFCDLGGNVQEWVADAFADSYTDAPNDGSARLKGHIYWHRVAQGKPQPVHKASSRILRGGSWRDGPEALRATTRRPERAKDHNPTDGFRVVLEVPR